MRSVDGAASLLDPAVAYCLRPGDEQRYDHPHAQGGDPALPASPLPTCPWIVLEHRLILTGARRGVDAHELIERSIVLTARTLAMADARRVASGRPATVTARRALADGVREALAANPAHSLPELARMLAVSRIT